eukprot:scaffold4510_cov183-Amphora_coffeaeformis.AAC.89
MPSLSKILASIIATMSSTSFVSAKMVQSKWTSAGYDAWAEVYFDNSGCNDDWWYYSNYLYANAYARQSKFKVNGKNGFVEATDLDDFYLYYTQTTCDGPLYRYQYGYVDSWYDYGGTVPGKFSIEGKKLTEASLKGLEMPIYENVCSDTCVEHCYPEIFDFGTCSDENPPDVVCYRNCSEEVFVGFAYVDVVWTLNGTFLPPPLEKSTSSYSSKRDGYSYTSRTKGSYRYDLPIILTAKFEDGSDLFSGPHIYSYSQLASTTYKDVSKYSYGPK